MGIPGIIAIVSQNKQLALGDNPFIIVGGWAGNIRFSQWDTVDTHDAIMNGNRFAWQADHPFNQIFVWIDGKNENNNVTAVWLARLISKLVNQDIFAVL